MNKTAAVIGAGTMGIGIAYSFATAGWATTVVEPCLERQASVRTQLRSVADEGVRRGKLTSESADAALERLHFVADTEQIAAELEVVIETVPEIMELKVRILRAAQAKRPRILASNTSALSIDELAASLGDPTNFLGAHFFNPVWSIHLVEIIRSGETSEDAVALMGRIAADIGKETAVVSDSPGFATSRLDLVAALEAMRMVEEGVASAEDIDRAMRVAYRHPVGPLRLSDIVGLDVRLHIAENLATKLGNHFAPPQILIDMVSRGELGEKSGKGFYEW